MIHFMLSVFLGVLQGLETMLFFAFLLLIYPKFLTLVSSIYTREPYYKYTGREILEDTKSWGRDDVSLNQLWIYNCKDAATTLEIALQQQVEIIESQKVVTSAGWWYKRHVKTMAFEMDQA